MFWLKNLQKTIKQNKEHLRILLGLVNDQSPYASDLAMKRQKISNQRKKIYLENKVIISKKTGRAIKLSNIVKTKEQDFAEIYCILSGIDEFAIKYGMSSAMITITAPCEFHPSTSNFNKKTPLDAHEFIKKNWNCCTKSFHRFKNKYYLFKVVEADKNGIPHWHILIYFDVSIKRSLQSTLMNSFKVNDLENQLIFWTDTDRKIGSFMSYVVKSIVPPDSTTFNALRSSNNERIQTFRKIWGIRKAQFSGLPKNCITTWREARKFVNKNVRDIKAEEALKKIKENNFCYFLSEYLDNNITLIFSSDKKIIGIKIYEKLVFKEYTNKNNLKVNTYNILNKVIIDINYRATLILKKIFMTIRILVRTTFK